MPIAKIRPREPKARVLKFTVLIKWKLRVTKVNSNKVNWRVGFISVIK